MIAPDELVGWDPPQTVPSGLDLAVLPMGVPEFDPFTGAHGPAEHPVLQVEATWAGTLEIARKLQAKRVIMTHIEEPFGLSHDDLQRLGAKLQADGFNIDFAFDTLQVEA